MTKITIDLPDELIDYLNHGKYVSEPSRFVAWLIRRWLKELANERPELSSTHKLKFEEAILQLVNQLKSLNPKPKSTLFREDDTRLYDGIQISHFLLQLETKGSGNAEVLKIFDLNILVDFSESDFFNVMQVRIRKGNIQVENLDPEHISLEELEEIIQSISTHDFSR